MSNIYDLAYGGVPDDNNVIGFFKILSEIYEALDATEADEIAATTICGMILLGVAFAWDDLQRYLHGPEYDYG